MRGLLLIAAMLYALPVPAAAEVRYFVSGNDLFEMCRQNGGYDAMSYSIGAVDMDAVLRSADQKQASFCAPDSVTRKQIGDVVCKFIRENPETRHWQAAALVFNAMNKAWPCKKP